MRSRILLLPEFDELSQFQDILARTVFHVGHAQPEAITFVVTPDLRASAEALVEDFVLPDDFDPAIVDMVPLVRDVVTIVTAGTPAADRAPRVSDVIAVWDIERFDESEWVAERGQRTEFLTIYDIDSTAIRLGASAFARLAERVAGSTADEENARFVGMLDDIGPAHDVLLFGSGPSVHEAVDQDLSRGVRIVCNTVILDAELMEHIQPQILTFADPIFHFGPSIYAANFRSAVRRVMAERPELWVVVPIRYRWLLAAVMPEHEARIIGIPTVALNANLVLDLRERFGVNPFPNILTMLMLPLAATIGRTIGLFGFDGREPGEQSFWQHGAKVQLGDDMPAIRRVHPGFFDVDYEDYYDTHSATVESLFQFCEERGIAIEGRTHSHMPSLRNRMHVRTHEAVDWAMPDDLVGHEGTIVVSLDPDWIGDFGHYGPWFRALAEENRVRGIPTIDLASRSVQGSAHPAALPTFSYPSLNPIAANLYGPQFETELNSAVECIFNAAPAAQLNLFFYTADIWHVPALVRLALRYPDRVRAVVNLMRSHGSIAQAAVDNSVALRSWGRAVSGLIQIGAECGVTVTVDTDELARLLEDISGVSVPVLPMASVLKLGPVRERERPEKLLFYCPAQSQQGKGVIEFARAARLVMGGPLSDNVEFRMRRVQQPARRDQRVYSEIDEAKMAGVEVIEGSFDDDGYAAAIEEADIIVVPYRAEVFRTRTSAVIVDSMRAGKPVVAAAGTWAARLIETAGSGVLFQSGDPQDLARAMTEAANRFDSLAWRAVAAADAISERFSMGSLAAYLSAVEPSAKGVHDFSTWARLEDLEAILASYVDGFQRGEQARRTWSSHLQRLNMRRGLANDTLAARCEELLRGIQDRDERLRDLAAHHEALQAAHDALTAEHAALQGDHKATVDWAAQLEDTVATLERGTGARILSAAKRRLGG